MKPLILMSFFVIAASVAYSQVPKTVVNCWISNGRIHYGHLAEFLPDSVKESVMVDPHKKYNIRDGNDILLWLEQQGWKLVAVDNSTTGTGGIVSSNSTCILTREISLDAAARALFIQKLENRDRKTAN